jgi:hypothetical protein
LNLPVCKQSGADQRTALDQRGFARVIE